MKYLSVLALILFSQYAYSETNCEQSASGYESKCESHIDLSSFKVSAQQEQNQTQWCWAASMSMLFAFNGFELDQSLIVEETYGEIKNDPIQSDALAEALTANWVDHQGTEFYSEVTGLYDVSLGYDNMSNERVIEELNKGNPLIIGSRGHAMVVTEIEYTLDSHGDLLEITRVGVYDPWPGRGERDLTGNEFVPASDGTGGELQFLAAVEVYQNRASHKSVSRFGTSSSKDGSVDFTKSQISSNGDSASTEALGEGGGAFDTLSVVLLLSVGGLIAFRRRQVTSR